MILFRYRPTRPQCSIMCGLCKRWKTCSPGWRGIRRRAGFLIPSGNGKCQGSGIICILWKSSSRLKQWKKAPAEQAAASPGENQSNSNSPSRETADQNRTRAVSGSNMANQAEPMKNAPATSTAPGGRQCRRKTEFNSCKPPECCSCKPAAASFLKSVSSRLANRQNASANRQQPASQSRQAAAPINRQPEAPQQPSSPQQSASAAMAGAESAAAGMSGDDDFRVYIGPMRKRKQLHFLDCSKRPRLYPANLQPYKSAAYICRHD